MTHFLEQVSEGRKKKTFFHPTELQRFLINISFRKIPATDHRTIFHNNKTNTVAGSTSRPPLRCVRVCRSRKVVDL